MSIALPIVFIGAAFVFPILLLLPLFAFTYTVSKSTSFTVPLTSEMPYEPEEERITYGFFTETVSFNVPFFVSVGLTAPL